MILVCGWWLVKGRIRPRVLIGMINTAIARRKRLHRQWSEQGMYSNHMTTLIRFNTAAEPNIRTLAPPLERSWNSLNTMRELVHGVFTVRKQHDWGTSKDAVALEAQGTGADVRFAVALGWLAWPAAPKHQNRADAIGTLHGTRPHRTHANHRGDAARRGHVGDRRFWAIALLQFRRVQANQARSTGAWRRRRRRRARLSRQ